MANSEARVEISAEARQMLEALKAIEKGFAAITTQITKQEEAAKKSNAATKKDLGDVDSMANVAVSAIGRIAAGWATVSTAIRLANDQYDKYKQRMQSAADTNQQFSAAVAAATRNAPAGVTGAQVEQMAISAAANAGLSPTAVAQAMPGVYAAGGTNLTGQQLQDVLQSTGPVAFGSVDEYGATAASAAGLMAQSGGQVNAQQAIGFLQTSAGGSAVQEYSLYAPLVGSVVGAATAMGFDVPQSIALFNATTRGTRDERGASSRTATIQYLNHLRKAQRELGLPANATPQQIIAALRDPANAAYAQEWASSLPAEASHLAFMQSITTPGGIGANFIDQGFQNTPTMAQAQQAYNDMASSVASAPSVQSQMVAQAVTGAAEQNYLRSGERGAVRKALEQYLASQDSSVVSDAVDITAYDAATQAGADPTDYVRNRLRQRAQRLRQPFRMTDADGVVTEIAPSQESLRQAEVLERLIATLDAIDATIANANQPRPPAANGDRPASPFPNARPANPAASWGVL